jgi:hypothetical protein
VPAAIITQALGSAPVGKLSTQSLNGATLATCTYLKGAVKLQVSIGPKVIASNGFGGPPGMVYKKDADLGPQGKPFYDTNPKYTFANVTFVKGAYYGSAWSNKLSINKVLLVAKIVYAGLH